jgi:hypothetical protein
MSEQSAKEWFPKLHSGPPEERIAFIERAIHLRSEIKQIFLDADHWNRSVRNPNEELINPDPQGDLKDILVALERFIGPETQ